MAVSLLILVSLVVHRLFGFNNLSQRGVSARDVGWNPEPRRSLPASTEKAHPAAVPSDVRSPDDSVRPADCPNYYEER